jgi:predicted metal-dependent phosphoesterase TrpH
MTGALRMDLHIHTCLSPCGAPENVPTRIVQRALEKRLDAIGICDHNSSENVQAVRRAAGRTASEKLHVFAGMEITTREEVHLLAIFEEEEDLARMQERVYDSLPGVNDRDVFGDQYIVDEEDYVTGYNEHLLIGATGMSIDETIGHVHRLGGLAIACHIDREAFSVISQLGFVPENAGFDALEVSPQYASSPFDLSPYLDGSAEGPPVVTFSDAHHIADIGRAFTEFGMVRSGLAELKDALGGAGDRYIAPVFT